MAVSSISAEEFQQGITDLHRLAQFSKHEPWRSSRLVKAGHAMGMRVRRSSSLKRADDSQDEMIVETEHDDGALESHTPKASQPIIVFDIIHSPTYLVPVLYIYREPTASLRVALPPSDLHTVTGPREPPGIGNVTLTVSPSCPV